MRRASVLPVLALLALTITATGAGEPPTDESVKAAMRRAGEFFRSQVSSGGGYVWRYSGDLKHRQGEGVATPTTIWIQPPGTPAIGEAFLDAYGATKDAFYLDAAREVGQALVQGQLQSGGWYYSVELAKADRHKYRYRVEPGSEKSLKKKGDDNPVGGWDVWKKHNHKDNVTVIDDDTTPAAVRFLIRLDQTLERKDEPVHAAVMYALESLLKAQYPIGAWSHNYDSLPPRNPDSTHYPPMNASFPESWSRTWTKDWNGCYSINDRITLNVIRTMILAWETYGDARFRESAERGGDFLIKAQLPEPQPAWAQQYDRKMQPVWERKFEPPAVTAGESQDALEVLMLLYRKTGNDKYLKPIPRALEYLKTLRLPDGRLARYNEIGTGKPLYFTRDYQLTYDGSKVPTHYAFVVPYRLDRIERDFRKLQAEGPGKEQSGRIRSTPALEARVRDVLARQDRRGAWVEKGVVRDLQDRKVEGDVIESATFIENMRTLGQFLRAER